MKRFYKEATVVAEDNGWQVMLDGRRIKTAGGRPQIAPTLQLAEALAAEWADQGEEINPSGFILRDLLDFSIDVVAPNRATTVDELLRYAETDTLCYRGDESEALHERQLEQWEPLLTAAEARWDIHFERISGIIHKPQPAATMDRMRSVLTAESDENLAALKTLSSLTASLVIALAAITPGAKATELWNLANLEEDWQAELWGKDAEAEARQAKRFAAFTAAMRFAELARP